MFFKFILFSAALGLSWAKASRSYIEGWPLAVFAMESNLPEGTGTCTSFNAAKVIEQS